MQELCKMIRVNKIQLMMHRCSKQQFALAMWPIDSTMDQKQNEESETAFTSALANLSPLDQQIPKLP